jgi:pimeloyl-ACP methyl ester carboxylesterase
MGTVTFRKVDVDGIGVFYREAGPKDAPTILLLHGFPTAGHMFCNLMPQLEDGFGYSLDNFYLARPGAGEIQLDLFGDYKSNLALYPVFQKYFRTHKPPLLAAWRKNDPFFLPGGAEAFRRDIPDAIIRFFDTGHFALETHAKDIAAAIRAFLAGKFGDAPRNT